MKKRVLFLIHDLGQGGAEKVLVNLVNHLDKSKFDISVIALFGGGVSQQFLEDDIHYCSVYSRNIPANSRWMKLFTPKQLHKKYIKEQYDIEVSYLEGPCSRIISGCPNKNTRLVSWIHTKYINKTDIIKPFRNLKETLMCYNSFDYTACVSSDVKTSFCNFLDFKSPCGVLYNTIESEKIKQMSTEKTAIDMPKDVFKIIAVGSLKKVKRFDRLLRITKRLKCEGKKIHTYIVGDGTLKNDFLHYIDENDLVNEVTLLGYDTNPYKYLSKSDLFVCSSQTEGFSTAATEALIVGTPVCTVDVSGMKEMLGDNNEYGVITENSEEALYAGIKQLLEDSDLLEEYRKRAQKRGERFEIDKTIAAVENMFYNL